MRAHPADMTDRPASLSKRITAFLMNRRRRLIVGVILITGIAEIAENLSLMRFGQEWFAWINLGLYLLMVPLGLWVLMVILETTASEQAKLTRDNNMRLEFSQKLGDAASLVELGERIVEFAHQVAPEANATLFIYNQATMRMDPEVACKPDGSLVHKPPRSLNPDTLPVGSLPQLLIQHGGEAYPRSLLDSSANLPPNRYDLPIMRSDETLGVVKLEYPLGKELAQGQIRALQSAAPVIGLALEVALLQKLAAEQAAASDSQRQQIAQNLHDTLAQNISYLRLKLDQLTGENAIFEIGVVLQELERMRAIADEAYQQVRGTLDELDPVHGEELTSVINKQARAICARAGFDLRVSVVGEPYNLPPAVRQQVQFIAREALHNVEKHSHAREVGVQYCWLDADFVLKISDDGDGFDPRKVTSDGHYGLLIMQQRAQEIGGSVKIPPVMGEGTEVTVWIPRPHSETAKQAETVGQHGD